MLCFSSFRHFAFGSKSFDYVHNNNREHERERHADEYQAVQCAIYRDYFTFSVHAIKMKTTIIMKTFFLYVNFICAPQITKDIFITHGTLNVFGFHFTTCFLNGIARFIFFVVVASTVCREM